MIMVEVRLDWLRGLKKSLCLSKEDKRVLRKIFGV